MRTFIVLIMFFVGMTDANALTPLPDSSPGFFAGEWAGAGEHGAYCYISLNIDGSGQVLVDVGSGGWSGARIQWHNQRQSLQVEKIIPLAFSAELRVMPLQNFVIGSQFNQSLTLTWNEKIAACHLQKIETSAKHLERARSTLEALQQGKKR